LQTKGKRESTSERHQIEHISNRYYDTINTLFYIRTKCYFIVACIDMLDLDNGNIQVRKNDLKKDRVFTAIKLVA
jgi:lipid II:glycine glycyltransferase (peptidoglycan interpeptide bridge formation enzyme)